MKVIDMLRKAGLITVTGDVRTGDDRTGDDRTGDVRAGDVRTGNIRTGDVRKGDEAPRPPADVPAPAPPPEVEALPLPEELSVPFGEIYAALKIPQPAHGWSVEKVVVALESAHMKALDPATQRAAVLAMLAANNVPPEDVVRDALHRDQALDKYEAFARRKIDQRQAGLKAEIAAEEAKIRDAQKAIAEKRAGLDQQESSFKGWIERKVKEEEVLVRVVSLFTSDHGITVGPTDQVERKQERGKD